VLPITGAVTAWLSKLGRPSKIPMAKGSRSAVCRCVLLGAICIFNRNIINLEGRGAIPGELKKTLPKVRRPFHKPGKSAAEETGQPMASPGWSPFEKRRCRRGAAELWG